MNHHYHRNPLHHLLLAALAVGACIFSPPVTVQAGPVIGVGRNHNGQAAAPVNQTNAVSVVAGRDFSFALNADGTVTGWGLNGEGRSIPPTNLTNVVALSAGIYHTLALKVDGTVTGWGFNGNDILSVPADLTNVLAVAAGGYHSLAVRRDGTVTIFPAGAATDDGGPKPCDRLLKCLASATLAALFLAAAAQGRGNRLANQGGTEWKVMTFLAHKSPKMAATYTEKGRTEATRRQRNGEGRGNETGRKGVQPCRKVGQRGCVTTWKRKMFQVLW